MELKAKLKDYFKRYPLSQECHVTSDGKLFHQSGPAQSYAGGLKDNKVARHTREDYVNRIETSANVVKGNDAPEGGDVTLENFDPTAQDAYAKALELAANLGLELKDRKKVTVLQAVEAAKAALEPKVLTLDPEAAAPADADANPTAQSPEPDAPADPAAPTPKTEE